MDKHKIIILALIVVIAALLVGMAFTMMPNMAKQDTKLKFKSNSTLTEGDSLKIKLTDANGTAIADQTINITIKDKKGASDNHSVVTNEKGVGTLKLDKNSGKYNVTVSYGGNDKYNGCNVTKKITVEEVSVEDAQLKSDNSDSSSQSGDSDSSSQNSVRQEDKVTPDGWNPREHEVSREPAGEGYERVRYDDDYFRIVDGDGNIVTYGYG